jgi:hypothetical protein
MLVPLAKLTFAMCERLVTVHVASNENHEERDVMKLYNLSIAIGALLAALAMGNIVLAADLPKEGTFAGSYTSFGSYKISKVGDRSFTIFDETGGQVTNGFADHLTMHAGAPEKGSTASRRAVATASELTLWEISWH